MIFFKVEGRTALAEWSVTSGANTENNRPSTALIPYEPFSLEAFINRVSSTGSSLSDRSVTPFRAERSATIQTIEELVGDFLEVRSGEPYIDYESPNYNYFMFTEFVSSSLSTSNCRGPHPKQQPPGEFELFQAVRMNNVAWIRACIEKKIDVNATDHIGDNALDSALGKCKLKEESCRALIELGIDPNNKPTIGDNALARIVGYYKKELSNPQNELKLFRCLLEGGASLEVTFKDIYAPVSVLSIIEKHPEMKQIIDEVNKRMTEEIFSALDGSIFKDGIKIITEMALHRTSEERQNSNDSDFAPITDASFLHIDF